METSTINLIDTIINGIGLIGIVILVFQFMKERKRDKKEETKERKVQLSKPLLSIWNDSIDNINTKLENDNDTWLIDQEQVNIKLSGNFYYVYLCLPHNRFITNAIVRYWRIISGTDSSSLAKYDSRELGSISPDKGYIQPILKDDNLCFFIYSVEYSNEINELMKFIVIALVDSAKDRITKIYDILCRKKDEKDIKTPKIFSSTTWDAFKKNLGDIILESLHHSALENEENWHYLSFTEKVVEKTCSAKVLKSKLAKLNISLNKFDEA